MPCAYTFSALRCVFPQVLEGEDDIESLYVHFAEFEEFCKEPERARAIYKFALDHVGRESADGLYSRFVAFEKKHGDRDHIEEVLLSKKRLQVRTRAPCMPWTRCPSIPCRPIPACAQRASRRAG